MSASIEFYNNTIELNNLRYDSHKRIIEMVAIELERGDAIDELIEKFLGKPLKFKKRKDPNLPKKALSSYIFFCKERRQAIQESNPDMKMTQVSAKLGEIWATLDEKGRQKYMDMHEKDKERYEEALENYMYDKNF